MFPGGTLGRGPFLRAAHAYFGRAKDGPADVVTTDARQAEVVAGKGIVGDRFFEGRPRGCGRYPVRRGVIEDPAAGAWRRSLRPAAGAQERGAPRCRTVAAAESGLCSRICPAAGAAGLLQDSLVQISDVLQEHYLSDFGPYENPLDPLVDEKQREAVENAEAAREQHNQFVDHGQHMVEDIVDSQQKEADEYFKRQLQVLEVRAEKRVKIFRD